MSCRCRAGRNLQTLRTHIYIHVARWLFVISKVHSLLTEMYCSIVNCRVYIGMVLHLAKCNVFNYTKKHSGRAERLWIITRFLWAINFPLKHCCWRAQNADSPKRFACVFSVRMCEFVYVHRKINWSLLLDITSYVGNTHSHTFSSDLSKMDCRAM